MRVGIICGWCLVWLYISVVPTTVRESATPDSKENKQADAGINSRLFFSKAFSVRCVVVIVDRQSAKVYLCIMYVCVCV